MSDYENVFGYMVKSYRSLTGLTQTDIAFKLGLSLRHYHRLEKGTRKPTIHTLKSCIKYKILSSEQVDLVDKDRIGYFQESGFIYKK